MKTRRSQQIRSLVRQAAPGALTRPLVSDRDPRPPAWLTAVFVLVPAAACGALVAFAAPGAWLALPVLAFAAAVLATEMVPFEISPGMHLSMSEVFLVLGLIVLAPHEVAAMSVLTIVLTFLWEHQSHLRAAVWACNAAVVHVPALTVVWALHAFGPPWATSVPALAVAALLTIRLFDSTLNAAITWWAMGRLGLREEGARYLDIVRMLGTSTHIRLTTVGLELPMTVLAGYAWQIAPATAVLVVAPFAVMWIAARQQRLLEQTRQRLRIDPLTQLFNRERFFEVGREELVAAHNFGYGLALIMGDLDNFKRVNDSLGHLRGDEVLRRAAAALSAGCDSAWHVVARYGGEEFAVLVSRTSVDEAAALAERLRASVEEALADFDSSISLGIAMAQPGDTVEDLIARADKALYAAKLAGKNRVDTWSTLMDGAPDAPDVQVA